MTKQWTCCKANKTCWKILWAGPSSNAVNCWIPTSWHLFHSLLTRIGVRDIKELSWPPVLTIVIRSKINRFEGKKVKKAGPERFGVTAHPFMPHGEKQASNKEQWKLRLTSPAFKQWYKLNSLKSVCCWSYNLKNVEHFNHN